MAISRRTKVPMKEQLRLIDECRRSGLTDADWCREHGIAPSTFYNWISRCKKASAGNIPAPNYGHSGKPASAQEVVPVDIIPGLLPEHSEVPAAQWKQPDIDNSHTIEISIRDICVRISNDADPVLLSRTLRLLGETLC